MARDYKPRGGKRKTSAKRKRSSAGAARAAKGRRSSRRRESAPGWQWLLSGLAAGLLVAAGVFVLDRLPGGVVHLDDTRTAPLPAASGATPVPAPASAASAADPAEVIEEDPPREYAFYDLLPRFEVVIPEEEETGLDAPGEGSAAVRQPGTYILQAGSFRQHEDADRMQALLALQGIESRIQVVTIDEASYHRVRIGPVDDLIRLDQLREQLRDAGVEYLVIRVGSPG